MHCTHAEITIITSLLTSSSWISLILAGESIRHLIMFRSIMWYAIYCCYVINFVGTCMHDCYFCAVSKELSVASLTSWFSFLSKFTSNTNILTFHRQTTAGLGVVLEKLIDIWPLERCRRKSNSWLSPFTVLSWIRPVCTTNITHSSHTMFYRRTDRQTFAVPASEI